MNGTFSLIWSAGISEYASSAQWGDYDNDGDIDQLIANYVNSANRSIETMGGTYLFPFGLRLRRSQLLTQNGAITTTTATWIKLWAMDIPESA